MRFALRSMAWARGKGSSLCEELPEPGWREQLDDGFHRDLSAAPLTGIPAETSARLHASFISIEFHPPDLAK